MFEKFIETLNVWNSTKSERMKLQYTYLALTLVIVLASGIISLFNAKDGHGIVRLALASLVIYFANAVVWSLLSSAVLSKLKSRSAKR